MKIKQALSDGTVIALMIENKTIFTADITADGIRYTHFSDFREAIASFSDTVEDDIDIVVFFRLIKQAEKEGYDIRTGRRKIN